MVVPLVDPQQFVELHRVQRGPPKEQRQYLEGGLCTAVEAAALLVERWTHQHHHTFQCKVVPLTHQAKVLAASALCFVFVSIGR